MRQLYYVSRIWAVWQLYASAAMEVGLDHA